MVNKYNKNSLVFKPHYTNTHMNTTFKQINPYLDSAHIYV